MKRSERKARTIPPQPGPKGHAQTEKTKAMLKRNIRSFEKAQPRLNRGQMVRP